MKLAKNCALALVVGLAWVLPGCERDNERTTERKDSGRRVRTVSDEFPPVNRDLPRPADSKSCGGDKAAACTETEFCQYPVGSCGTGTAGGLCMTKPEICAELVEPVCGCDDKEYGNECKAWMAGVSIRSRGHCTDKPKP
jgi:hypothetical protein